MLAASPAFLAGILQAQSLEPRPVVWRGVDAYEIRSPTMGVRYEVLVGVPPGFRAAPGRKYPALIVTDGYGTFPAAYDAMRTLVGQGTIRDLLVISVGAPFDEGDSAFTRRRVYEFSPPGWAMTDPFGKEVTRVCRAFGSPPDRCVGGAPRFLDFIASELIPRLAERYPIDREQLGLFGLSAGGFFASWAIFQERSPFRTYIISSPAMAYGDGEIFRQEEKWAASHKDLGAAIFIASGSLEADDPMLEGVGRIVSGQMHLAAMLRSRKYPGLSLYSEINPGLGHADGAATTLARGMRLLYAK